MVFALGQDGETPALLTISRGAHEILKLFEDSMFVQIRDDSALHPDLGCGVRGKLDTRKRMQSRSVLSCSQSRRQSERHMAAKMVRAADGQLNEFFGAEFPIEAAKLWDFWKLEVRKEVGLLISSIQRKRSSAARPTDP